MQGHIQPATATSSTAFDPGQPLPHGTEPVSQAKIGGRYWKVLSMSDVIEFCSICKEDRLASRAMCSLLNHAICEVCEKRFLKSKQCFQCKKTASDAVLKSQNDSLSIYLHKGRFECLECSKPVDYTGIEYHIKHCSEQVLPCPYAEYGCPDKSTKSDLIGHEPYCRYKPVTCIYQCGILLSPDMMAKHKTECRKRQVTEGQLTTTAEELDALKKIKLEFESKDFAVSALSPDERDKMLLQCQIFLPQLTSIALAQPERPPLATSFQCQWNCGMLFDNQKTLTDHISNCPLRLVSCEYCHEQTAQNQLQTHWDSCLNKPVNCPNECGERPARRFLITGEHFKYYCTMKPVNCPNCQTLMPIRLLANHQETACEKNLYECSMCLTSTPFYQKNSHNCPIGDTVSVSGITLHKPEEATGPIFKDLFSSIKHWYFIIPTKRLRDALEPRDIQQDPSETTIHFMKSDGFNLTIEPDTGGQAQPGALLNFSGRQYKEWFSSTFYTDSKGYSGHVYSFPEARKLFSLREAYSGRIEPICPHGWCPSMKTPWVSKSDYDEAQYQNEFILIQLIAPQAARQ